MKCKAAGTACAECPFAVNGRPVNFVEASIPTKVAGLVVVEAPCKEEVEKRQWFADRAGEEFTAVAETTGIDLREMAIVPAVHCSRKQPEADPEMRQAMKCCRPLFEQEAKGIVVPVLALGKWAAMAVTGKEKAIGSIRGFYQP